MARSKFTVKLDREAADFLLSLYSVLDVGGPAEKSLSDFADQLLDSNGPSKEYEFYAHGVRVKRFKLIWREPKENKAR